jgi:hypothetical protein
MDVTSGGGIAEHLSTPPIFVSGIRVAQSLIIRVDVL